MIPAVAAELLVVNCRGLPWNRIPDIASHLGAAPALEDSGNPAART